MDGRAAIPIRAGPVGSGKIRTSSNSVELHHVAETNRARRGHPSTATSALSQIRHFCPKRPASINADAAPRRLPGRKSVAGR